MIFSCILVPGLFQLEKHDVSASQTLRSALTKAETSYPGLAYDLIVGILRKGDLTVNMNESILRLQGAVSDSDGNAFLFLLLLLYIVFKSPFFLLQKIQKMKDF